MTIFKRTGSGDFSDDLKALLSGDPKSGKTTFLGSVPNIVILDTEPHANNLQSVAHLNIPYATITSSSDLAQAQLMLQDTSMRGLMAEQLGMDKIEAVAIDTLDTLQSILKKERMKQQRSTEFLRDDWGWLKEEMVSIISGFTALPLHVFFTVHTKTKDLGDQKKGDGRTVVLPGLEGSIAESIAGMVGYSLMTFRRQEVDGQGNPYTKYWLRAEGDETYGFVGNRAAGRLPDVIEPDFKHLHAAAVEGRKRAQAAQEAAVAAKQTGQADGTAIIAQTPPAQPQQGQSAMTIARTKAQPPVQTGGQNLVQNADQQQAQPAGAPVNRPADDEPINVAAITHVKRVYDGLNITFPEDLIKSKTVGEARLVVKMWKAIQEDHAAGKGTGATPQAEMVEFLSGMGWLPESGAQARPEPVAVEAKIDGTIDQVKAYVNGDLTRAQEAFDAEYAKDKPRAGLIDWLIAQGVKIPTSKPAEPIQHAGDRAGTDSDQEPTPTPEVQTPVENPTPEPEPEAVTPAPETVDAPPTEGEAIATVKEALGGEVVSQTGEGTCDMCGKPIDDADIAALSMNRFGGKRYCVNDYIAATRAS